jgi:hypothetical protein
MIKSYPISFFTRDDSKVIVDKTAENEYQFTIKRENGEKDTLTWRTEPGQIRKSITPDEKIAPHQQQALNAFWELYEW